MKKLTQRRLKILLSYDQETGEFVWRVASNGRIHIGQAAGYVKPDGYRQIKVDGVLYGANRLAWLYMTGAWPHLEQVDHRNGARDDNRWENLREASRSQNNQNQRRAHRRNKSAGLLGVSQRNKGNGFQARIRFNGKEKRLGSFASAELAHAAYVTAKRQLHPGCTI